METQATNGILEEFRLEFLECWHRLPNKLSFLSLLVAWVALFQFIGNSTLGYVKSPSLFAFTFNALTRDKGLLETEEGYAVLIPVVVAGLFWLKRRQLLAQELRSWWPGLLIVVLALAIHWLGFTVQQPKISLIGFFIGIYGLMGMAWGLSLLRASFFPFFLLGFCVPISGLADPITFRMRLLVSQLVGFVSHYILAIDVHVQGNMLMDPTGRYQYEIAAACSGIRSLTATLALAVILAFVSFQKPWKRLLMIVSALPLAILGNLIRMLTIIIAAEIGGQEWGTYVHDGGPGGVLSLLPYIPAFIGLLWLERYLKSEPPPPLTPIKQLKLKET